MSDAPKLKQVQSQSQQLVMGQSMQQAIKLLQLNNHELDRYLEDIVLDNPFLEKESATNSDNFNTQETRTDTNNEEWEAHTYAKGTLEPYVPNSNGGIAPAGGDDNYIETRTADTKSFRDVLLEQLFTLRLDQRDSLIGSALIDRLDDHGYLTESISELSKILGCSESRLQRVLAKLKNFEPTGVFSSGLEESLSLQLEEKDRLTPKMQKLLTKLDLLALHDYTALRKHLDVDHNTLEDMIGLIQTLNPRPSSKFDDSAAQSISPDVFMRKRDKKLGGGWSVELNNETLPRVLLNMEYATEVSALTANKDEKSYIKSQLNTANWLIKAVDQRAQTILKISAAIIEEQDAFFQYGVEYLKPLTLKDIAEKIEMHESTVSRVTSQKFMSTPRGVYALKFFFSSSIKSDTSSYTHSSKSVQERIKDLIDQEEKVLSDDKIVALLKGEDIEIARRTVTKYREILGIPSSVLRRKIKNNKQKG